jgi:hypothetical protein
MLVYQAIVVMVFYIRLVPHLESACHLVMALSIATQSIWRQDPLECPVLPSSTQSGEIGYVYPSPKYCGNRPSQHPALRR